MLNQVPIVRVWRSCAKTGELFWFDSQGSRVFGERVRVFLGVKTGVPGEGGGRGGKVQGEW